MSPTNDAVFLRAQGFPRVSGDEPLGLSFRLPAVSFSPRERG